MLEPHSEGEHCPNTNDVEECGHLPRDITLFGTRCLRTLRTIAIMTSCGGTETTTFPTENCKHTRSPTGSDIIFQCYLKVRLHEKIIRRHLPTSKLGKPVPKTRTRGVLLLYPPQVNTDTTKQRMHQKLNTSWKLMWPLLLWSISSKRGRSPSVRSG